MNMSKDIILSQLGRNLLTLSIVVLALISFFIPEMLSRVNLSMDPEWPMFARIVFQLTIGSWCATFVASAGRVIVWIQAMDSEIGCTEYKERRDQVKMVQSLFVWILGLMTALSGYIAVLLK